MPVENQESKIYNQRQIPRTPPSPNTKPAIRGQHPILLSDTPITQVLPGESHVDSNRLTRLNQDLGEIPQHTIRELDLLAGPAEAVVLGDVVWE